MILLNDTKKQKILIKMKKEKEDYYEGPRGCERIVIIIFTAIILLIFSCSTEKYTARKYEIDRKKNHCPAYGFNRIENKHYYFIAPKAYQQTYSYKYGPWYRSRSKR